MMKKLLCLHALALSLAAFGPASMAQDVKAGEKKAAQCIGCHGIPGYQASFPEVYKVPKISGQNAKYLANALDAYRKGDRKHPTMRGVAGPMSDADIADLAAFYEQHRPLPATGIPAEAAPPPAALKDRMAACVACHGANYNNTTDPANPRLAGQHADFLAHALRSYMTDGNPKVGRANVTMRGMLMRDENGKRVYTFTPGEIKQMAAYLSGLPGQLNAPKANTFR